MGSVGPSGDARARASAVRALVETVKALAAEARSAEGGGGGADGGGGGGVEEKSSSNGNGSGNGNGASSSSSRRAGPSVLPPPSPSSWDRRLDRAAAVDFSWDVPAREWEQALRGLLAAERWKWWER